MTVYDGGVTGQALAMGIDRTPEAGFSNGAAVAFGIFTRGVIEQCFAGLCSTGFTCDPQMGICSNTPTADGAIPCQIGQQPVPAICSNANPHATCVPSTGGGVCEDLTSSENDGTADGHQLSIAYQMRVANADLVIPEHWYSQVWVTNKFANMTARTVNNFDPNNPATADYTPANGLNPIGSKVFLFGRPVFIGAGSLNPPRDAELYFAYVSIPIYSPTANFAWAPQYFTGTDASGKPQFSPDPSRAAPLNLNGLPKPSSEQYDIVNQIAVSYVPNMHRWVMFYGGDTDPDFLQRAILGPNGPYAQRAPDLAIHARFATNPWGPWSAPQPVFAPGNPAAPAPGSAFAEFGPMYDNTCTPVTSPPCVPTEVKWGTAYTFGFLYGANIIDPWTTPRGPLNRIPSATDGVDVAGAL